MPQFRAIVEAFQLRDPDEPGHVDAFHAWSDRVELRWESDRNGAIVVHTADAEDVLGAEEGDWIVAKGGGVFAVLSKDDFDGQYEPKEVVMASPPDNIFAAERLESPRECLVCWRRRELKREMPRNDHSEPLWRCGHCGSTLSHGHLSLVEAGANAMVNALGPEWLPVDRTQKVKRFLWNLFAEVDYDFQSLPDDPALPGPDVCATCSGRGVVISEHGEAGGADKWEDCPDCGAGGGDA